MQGKRVELKLKVFSSFAQVMSVQALSAVPTDPRFVFEGARSDRILAGQKNYVGKMLFDPAALCRADDVCYSGFATTSKCRFNTHMLSI